MRGDHVGVAGAGANQTAGTGANQSMQGIQGKVCMVTGGTGLAEHGEHRDDRGYEEGTKSSSDKPFPEAQPSELAFASRGVSARE